MKKLLIMLLAVATAGIIHAAQVNWTFTGSTAIQGYSLYVLTSELSNIAEVSDISSAAASTVASLSLNPRGNATTAGGTVTGLSGNNGDTRTLYFYVVSGDSYYYAGSQDGTQYVPGEGSGTPAARSATSIPALPASGSGNGWVDVSPIPEPTSVALLALGLAALGLKRKVA